MVSEATSLFRENTPSANKQRLHVSNGLATLFQTMAVMERCVLLNTRAGREVPAKVIQDHDVHTPVLFSVCF